MATNGSGGGNSDEPRAITLDKNENVVVTGSGSGTGLYYFVTVKYIQGPNAVEQTDETIPKDFALYQNYPNPFNPSTTIHFELPKETHVTLKVYNMLGQEMMTLVNENKDVGRYEVKFNASTLSSGVYYYRLVAGQFMETKKLILIR
jgi:hypothetical protein